MTSTYSSQVTRYADMFAAMGTEARLSIMQLLMTAEPKGMVVGDIQSELEIPNSTLSHHLDKLRNEDLVTVRREGTFLWYRANTDDSNFWTTPPRCAPGTRDPRKQISISK